MANFLSSVGGGNQLDIYDLTGTLVKSITFIKGVTRTGHPAKIAPMTINFTNSQNELGDLFDDYLMDIAADEITLTAEDNTQEKIFAAEDAVRAADKLFYFIYYYSTNRGVTPITRDVMFGVGYLAGDSGNATTANNTEIDMPLQIITARPSTELSIATAKFNADKVYVAAAQTIPTSGAGSYGKIVSFPIVDPA